MIRKILALLLLIVVAAPAQAQWREAQTRNFIVYSEASEADLREFAGKLERFDFVLRRAHNVTTPNSPNRLRVFLLTNISAVGAMAGFEGVAGYYVSDARGMMMVGTRNSRTGGIDAESILLHEYTHHFMYHYFPAAYPTWYSEGFAEFWGSTRILPNDVVEIGRPAEHRFGSINPNLGFTNMARWLEVERLLTAQSYRDVPEVDLLYAEGWMLVRYAWENPERRRQLNRYLALINEGRPFRDAAVEAFGDLRRLNDELYEYSGRRRFNVLTLPFRTIDIGEVTVRTLTPAENALLPYEIRLSQGVPNIRFAEFAAGARAAAARFPDDPFALRLLTEIERVADDNAAALTAVDRLLQLRPDDPRGLVHKSMIEVDALRAARSADAAAWTTARERLLRAMRLAPADPLPHEAFYDSFVAQGVLPPEEAQGALYTALDLAPSDERLRYKLASDFEQRSMIPEAIAIIRIDAYRTPPRRDETERERARRQRLEDRYRRAGTTRQESAREMLARLVARQGDSAAR